MTKLGFYFYLMGFLYAVAFFVLRKPLKKNSPKFIFPVLVFIVYYFYESAMPPGTNIRPDILLIWPLLILLLVFTFIRTTWPEKK